MKEKVAVIGSLVLLIGVCFSVYFYFESRYALSQELKQTQQRLEYKIISDQLQSVQDRIWKVQDRCESNVPKDPTVKEELRQLEKTKDDLKGKLDKMEKK